VTPADAQLQAATADQIGGGGLLGCVQGILVPHVDDRGADLDPLGFRADCRQQRKRRAELAGEVMDAKISAVGAEFFSGDGQVDGLQKGVGGRSRLRLPRRRPMAE
jgi:hypothetical protein